MKINHLIKNCKYLMNTYSVEIFSGLAVAGVVTTTILAVKAAPEARYKIISGCENEYPNDEIRIDPSFIDKIKYSWRSWIPTATSMTLTVGCIFAAQRMSSKKAIALASALTLSETTLKEYRDGIINTFGSDKENKLKDKLSASKFESVDQEEVKAIVLLDNEQLCFDEYSGRLFKSNIETIRRVVNDINEQILNEAPANLNDFYDKLGLDGIGAGEVVGWNSDNLCQAHYTSILTKDSKPALCLSFINMPNHNYWTRY